MKIFSSKKRVAVIGAITAVTLVGGGTAFAYFTTTGTGTGAGAVGTATALVLTQKSITYSNAATDNNLLPGTSADVTFTVDNPSSGVQRLGTVSLAGFTSDKPGCNSDDQSTWFTAVPLPVNTDYIPGANQPVTGKMTIKFENKSAPQDACKGATLEFNYTSN
jgi:hypothetical protein